MHEDPHIPNRGKAGRGLRLVPGLVLAIEPWFIAGGKDGIYLDEDGWTIRTADGSRAAHAEHTIAITADGPVILTARALTAGAGLGGDPVQPAPFATARRSLALAEKRQHAGLDAASGRRPLPAWSGGT